MTPQQFSSPKICKFTRNLLQYRKSSCKPPSLLSPHPNKPSGGLIELLRYINLSLNNIYNKHIWKKYYPLTIYNPEDLQITPNAYGRQKDFLLLKIQNTKSTSQMRMVQVIVERHKVEAFFCDFSQCHICTRNMVH